MNAPMRAVSVHNLIRIGNYMYPVEKPKHTCESKDSLLTKQAHNGSSTPVICEYPNTRPTAILRSGGRDSGITYFDSSTFS